MIEDKGMDGDGDQPRGCHLIYFSSVPYASYAQRPHFMVEAFVDSGFDSVLWIDPYPTRFPSLGDLKRIASRGNAGAATSSHNERIKVLTPAALPIEPLPLSGLINGVVAWRPIRAQLTEYARDARYCVLAIGRPSKLAEWALDHVRHDASFIDVLDNFPAFYRGLSRLSMMVRLRAVCRRATDVYCSSSQLAAELGEIRRDARVVLNGYSTNHLPAPSRADMRRYIGYVGSIAEWFDWPLVRSLAISLPDVTVRLVGPEFVDRPADLPSNIEFLGERPQAEIAGLVREFAVGLIPFKVNDLTEGVDPIKFYEYRSMGVPIWSTTFGEMTQRGEVDGVTHVTSRIDWRRLWQDVQAAVAPSFDEIASFRAAVSWERRFEPILSRSRRFESEGIRRNRPPRVGHVSRVK
ncbi:glycosyl transferase [Burkholderia cenocepacia]|uniref:glycosyl transferase n=1 Tax=Burkholderia cenocepacia TaxID=95486 RepID=UPI0006793A17|nr:glycosyl transferase [Burkholderia cenocepacia]MBO1855059.1 glycosyltransferase [Burkholderia cenocepacia]MDR5642004.1 glycosyltransferase [Burkholderia cenocepacia]